MSRAALRRVRAEKAKKAAAKNAGKGKGGKPKTKANVQPKADKKARLRKPEK
ncbi:hypothetical protein ABZ851_00550 [Streptomyces sp. NPDC047049]|uniref:hypothetical protein n=1 Tax=Streptomyces sp. NPDC047049 TaxID=3156688 RepID=UPI0033CAB2AB